MKRFLVALFIVLGLVASGCGGGDDDPSPAVDAATDAADAGGADAGGDAELVSIRSLGFDLPAGIVWDVPVPADSEFDGTAEIADQSIVFVISDADPDSLAAPMDDFFDATFDAPIIDPDFDAWQGTEPSDAGIRGLNVGFQRCADDTCGWNVRIEVASFDVAS